MFAGIGEKNLLLGNYTLLRVLPIRRRERLLGELKELLYSHRIAGLGYRTTGRTA